MNDAVDVRSLIAERFPDLRVHTLKRLGEGDFHHAYLINDEWVLRIAKHRDAGDSLRREVALLTRIGGRFELTVPAFELVALDAPSAMAAHRLIPGPHLSKERYGRLAETDREACCQQLGDFLRELHATDRETAQSSGLRTRDFTQRAEEVLRKARQHAFVLLDPASRDFVETCLTTAPESRFEPVVLHGDLSPDHIMFDTASRRITGIIDFGDVAIGDPAWDFVYIYEDYGLDLLRRGLAAYGPPAPRAFIERIYAWYVLDLIEWVAECSQAAGEELDSALTELTRAGVHDDRQLTELLRACLS